MQHTAEPAVDPIRMVAIVDTALDVGTVYAAVTAQGAGGIALFVGTVRRRDAGNPVQALDYTAHPTALNVLREVAEEVAAEYRPVALAAVHRVGDLVVGDLAVVVAVATEHRAEAFTAARDLIDKLKQRVPIWKHQVFDDGTDEWVGTP